MILIYLIGIIPAIIIFNIFYGIVGDGEREKHENQSDMSLKYVFMALVWPFAIFCLILFGIVTTIGYLSIWVIEFLNMISKLAGKIFERKK